MTNHELPRRFAAATGIPVQVFHRGIHIRSYGAAKRYTSLALSIAGSLPESAHPVCYTRSDEFLFCGMVRQSRGAECFLLGPVAAFPCTRRLGQKILARLGQPENRIYELLRWFKSIPLCDPPRFQELLVFFDYMVNRKTDHQVVFVPCRNNTVSVNLEESNVSFIEHLSGFPENALVSAIEYGKTETITALFDELESWGDGVPQVASDADRAFKNIFIFATGIISRAALRGGLDYDTITAMSDYYLQRIEATEGYAEIFQLMKKMFLDFTQKTARVRQPETASPLARRINKVIMARLYEKISPTVLAEILGMNCSYLCRRFKEETGKTISEYINEVKITEARCLLESTELPLAQISAQLGFSSQNYFQTIFKEITGATPGKYRNRFH
ncbi:MAG: helix-turn-helix transcriptional regulator [Treponema sp.]|jgi:AraC-like DNA-binding protein|nr:helix-turn-helix transcriptional regulator [Treponema sp.]